jgi:hypothetical protein
VQKDGATVKQTVGHIMTDVVVPGVPVVEFAMGATGCEPAVVIAVNLPFGGQARKERESGVKLG